jgi:transcriptional regulator with AAA-type ATPase domain
MPRNRKTGCWQSPLAGTVFMEEGGELPIDLQAKLLCTLQEKEIRPLGSTKRAFRQKTSNSVKAKAHPPGARSRCRAVCYLAFAKADGRIQSGINAAASF